MEFKIVIEIDSTSNVFCVCTVIPLRWDQMWSIELEINKFQNIIERMGQWVKAPASLQTRSGLIATVSTLQGLTSCIQDAMEYIKPYSLALQKAFYW